MSMSAADRISELPEGILHHILSYLPSKNAVSTSVLSKRWNNVWETLPYLNFNKESFMTCNSDNREQFGKNIDLLAAMRRIVRSRRERQHISIQKFCLFVPPWQDKQLDGWPSPSDEEERSRCREIVFSCLSYLATPFLKELKLINGITWQSGSSGNLDLLLPPNLLSVKWLTTLNLKGFDLLSSCSSMDINFTCLQKLALEYVILDDNILKNLTLGSCSSLETLKLKHCTGLKIIHLDGEFIKFKQLKVHFDIRRSIEVVEAKVYDTPEFEDLRVLGYRFSKSYFNVKNCPRLKKIFIDGNFITENKLQQLLASFEHLEELNFKNCCLLKNINISSDSLKTLSLYSLYSLEKLHIFSPTLKSFTFELPDHVFDFSLNGSDVGFQVNLIIHTQFGFRCVKFLQNFKHTKKVTIKYNTYDLVIIPEYIIEKLLSPLYGTRDISFKQGIESPILKILMKDKVTKLLEYLLWLAPRAERVSIVSFDNTTLLSLELVYHNVEEKKIFNCCYCKLLPINCWRHCLEEVKIYKFEEMEYYLPNLKDFFLKEVKNLKIVDNVN